MSQTLRLSEKWFNRALWAVAGFFAWFLTGLGNHLIGDLPRVEENISLDRFVDHASVDPLRSQLRAANAQQQTLLDQLEQAQLQLNTRQKDYQAARHTFDNWLATRDVTKLSNQNDELLTRTQVLDQLKGLERGAEKSVEALHQQQTDLSQHASEWQRQLNAKEETARKQLDRARQQQATRVFLYRLLLTLPLLLIAAWLFVNKRTSPSWPFVWGFIIFALLAFFVELVPYLPDYGGYVRYLVGIVLTVVGGKYAIAALQRYLDQQRLAEAQPELQRREVLQYDTALERLGKSICPGCERGVDLKNEHNDFCMHCGICLHNYCAGCQTRKNAFAKYCHQCGSAA